MRSEIVPGDTFPDHELPDHTGKVCKLSELQGDDPLILTLARGHYCPKEHQQHLELAASVTGITDAVNLHHEGKYPDLQTVAPGATWTESFWILSSGI
jgi:peroxiredoxin